MEIFPFCFLQISDRSSDGDQIIDFIEEETAAMARELEVCLLNYFCTYMGLNLMSFISVSI